jgi:hypothetical protein
MIVLNETLYADVSDVEMRDDELMKAGRSSSIGCGSGSSKQDWVVWLKSNCSSQVAAPKGKKWAWQHSPLAVLQGGCRTRNCLLIITIFQFNKYIKKRS